MSAATPSASSNAQQGTPSDKYETMSSLYHGDAIPFTLRDLKEAIPKHCFERPVMTSMLHLISDLVQLVAYTVAYYYFSNMLQGWWAANPEQMSSALYYLLQTILFVSYVFIEGVTFTGLWVLQHECGHYAFADSPLVCDIVGYLVGSALMVPYFAWQKSHAIHHANTNHMTRDQTWVPQNVQPVPSNNPAEKPEQAKNVKLLPKTASPLSAIFDMIVLATVGWPLHLMVNISGPIKENVVAYYWKGIRYEPAMIKENGEHDDENEYSDYKQISKKSPISFTSHYLPSSPIFNKSETLKIHLSNLGIVAMLYFVYQLYLAFGWQVVMTTYVLPLCVNFFLLTSLTFLQHIHDDIPHLDEGEWTWLKGAALCTVDRSMGAFLDHKLHHICDTHVCHHVFSKIPFYHAEEATRAIRAKIGPVYFRDETANSFFGALYVNLQKCVTLKRSEKYRGILWWDQ